MSNLPTSQLRMRSIGIVVKAKELGSLTIIVDPIEDLSLDSGPISEDSKTLETNLPGLNGVKKKTTLTGGSTIEATWLPEGNSNRATPPDVNANESVKIWQFGDAPTYYWSTLKFEPELRRLERVRYMYSNLPSGLEAFDEKTSYYVEISTIDKKVRLVTNDNDGEAVAYNVEFDTKNGVFTLEDNVGNKIILESVGGLLTANVNEVIEANTKIYRVNADEIEFNSKKLTMKSGAMSISSETPAEVSCDMVMKGDMKLVGDVNQTGSFETSGNVTAEKVIDRSGNTNHHNH